MKSSILFGLSLLGVSFASPVAKRASAYSDADILNYALTLEHLEATFYRQGIANFTQAQFLSAGFDYTTYANLKEVAYDEATHVDFLTKALSAAGATPVPECTYNFGVTSVATFLATASILEGVGVSAYLGAAASINNPAYLTAAGSILTVEARHNAYLRAALKASPFPQAFDSPLGFNSVYSLAAPFIVSCPSSPAFTTITLKPFPALAVTTTGTIYTGSTVKLQSKVTNYSGPLYASFATVTGPVFATIDNNGGGAFTITVPAGVHGQSYLTLTSSNDKVSDANTITGPAIVPIANADGMP